MSKPLQLLPNLRKFGGKDESNYLMTQMRQNLKAIEFAFNFIEDKIKSFGSKNQTTSFTSTSTAFVDTGLVVTNQSIGSPCLIALGAIERDFQAAFAGFSISTSSNAEIEIRRNDKTVIYQAIITSALPIRSTLIAIDLSPPEGLCTYRVFVRQSSAGTFTISNTALSAVRV